MPKVEVVGGCLQKDNNKAIEPPELPNFNRIVTSAGAGTAFTAADTEYLLNRENQNTGVGCITAQAGDAQCPNNTGSTGKRVQIIDCATVHEEMAESTVVDDSRLHPDNGLEMMGMFATNNTARAENVKTLREGEKSNMLLHQEKKSLLSVTKHTTEVCDCGGPIAAVNGKRTSLSKATMMESVKTSHLHTWKQEEEPAEEIRLFLHLEEGSSSTEMSLNTSKTHEGPTLGEEPFRTCERNPEPPEQNKNIMMENVIPTTQLKLSSTSATTIIPPRINNFEEGTGIGMVMKGITKEEMEKKIIMGSEKNRRTGTAAKYEEKWYNKDEEVPSRYDGSPISA